MVVRTFAFVGLPCGWKNGPLQLFSALEDFVPESLFSARIDEQIDWLGIEGEHIIVAGDCELCSDRMGEFRCFITPQISSDASGRFSTVDW